VAAYVEELANHSALTPAPSAGAFGGPGPLFDVDGPPALLANYDVNQCVDALTEEPLEGHAVVPDVIVEYDPADLAAGIDTVLEAAVALVVE
jgi:hypothetical protein